MINVVISGYNTVPSRPKDWQPPASGPCEHMVVRVVRIGTKTQACETAWLPTEVELAVLNAGGHVVLSVQGWQVPCSLTTEPAIAA